MKQEEAVQLARQCFPQKTIGPVEIQPLCRLWSGMGHIYKVSFQDSSSNVGVTESSFVVKRVDPPPPGAMSLGDRRKAASYVVEANFYEHCAKRLMAQHSIALPEPYFVDHPRHDGQITICMSCWNDHSASNTSFEEPAIRWLANFHAATWEEAERLPSPVKKLLQPTGSYWHLDTRPDEHESMPRSGWQGRLKRAARAIDARLKRDRMQCVIHGDPKDSNILWTSNDDIAFCDFQYCGKGCPTQDLAYFLCSSTDPDDEEALLSAYYEELVARLPKNISVPSMKDLKESMELAYCDFARFMSGWGFWGFDIKDRTIAVLDRLDNGKNLGSEEEYDAAVRREYG